MSNLEAVEGGVKRGELVVIVGGRGKGTSLWGNTTVDVRKCGIEPDKGFETGDCGCGFGQCAKGLIY